MLYEFDRQLPGSLTNGNSELTDQQLMSGVQAGDEKSLSALFTRHHLKFRVVVGRVLNNDAEVDDVLQECMFEVWRRAAIFEERKGKPLAWLVTIVRRRAIDWIRRRETYHGAQERFAHFIREVEPGLDHVEPHIENLDRKENLKKMLDELPPRQREALHLAFYSGLSQREIAARTQTPLGTIKTRLELGLKKLRAALEFRGGRDEWSPSAT